MPYHIIHKYKSKIYVGLDKGVPAEAGRVPELATNCSQGRVRMLYTYIGLNLNFVLSVMEC